MHTSPLGAVWDGCVLPYTVPGLSSCLEEGRITLDGVPLAVSPLEVDALRLVEHAVARAVPLLLCPADPLVPLAALIPAAIHMASMTEARRRHGVFVGSDRRVVVVTRDFRIRGCYRGLGVRAQARSTSVPMRQVVPAATLGRGGALHVLVADRDRGSSGWSTLFVDTVADVARVPGADIAVVELPAADAYGLLDLDIPVVVVAKDPADPAVGLLLGRVAVFAWDDADIRGVAGLTPRLARRATGAGCQVVRVVHDGVCENADLFWQDVGPLVRVGRSALARELAREAFGLFYDLLGLALPLARYEELTGVPVEGRVRALGRAARLTAGEARELYLPMVEAELAGLAAALGDTPAKHDALVHLLGAHVDEHRDTLLVARTAALARAYAAHLATVGLGAVRVTSLGVLAAELPADVAVLTGMVPTWAGWVYRSGVASTVQVLAYAPQAPDEAPVRFSEVDVVRRSVALQADRAAWLARPALKARTWAQLTGAPVQVDDDGPAPIPDAGDVSVLEPPAPPEVPPGLWSGRGWFAALEPLASASVGRGPADALDAVVPAVRVRFADGRWALLETNGTVRRWRAATGQVDPAFPVARLCPGDTLVFIDGDGHKDLLDKVVEVTAKVPALATAADWVAHWHGVVKAAKEAHGSFAALGRALRDRGCRVEDQTVRLWVVGVTIGPDDPADVRRVGEETGDPVLLDRHAEVHRAIRTLRGAHAKLGRRLIRLEQQLGPAAATGRLAGDELVDEASGLTAADFQHSIDLAGVASTEAAGDVPRVLTGRLRASEEEGDA